MTEEPLLAQNRLPYRQDSEWKTRFDPMAESKSTFLRFLRYVYPYWKDILIGAVGGIVKFTVPAASSFYLVRYLVDHIFLNEELTTPEQMQRLFWVIGGMTAVYILFFAPWTFVRHFNTSRAGHRAVFDLRCDLYYWILRMSASFFSRNQSGGIVSRLVSDIQLAQNLVGSALTNVWIDGSCIIVVLILMMRVDLGITIAALVTFPIYLFLFRMLRDRIRKASHQVQQEIANLSGNVTEKISGSTVVRAFTQEKSEEKKFFQDSRRVFSSSMRTQYLQSLNMMFTATITNIAPLIVFLYGGYKVIHGSMTPGDLLGVTVILPHLYLPLQRFSELNVIFSNSMAALDRIFEIMDERPEVVESSNAIVLEKVQGRVDFEHVTFSYRKDIQVLKDVNFTAEAGKTIALVGHSGSGKSTLVSLLPRFYDVDSGVIRIDGLDIRDAKVKSLRQHIGMVLQDPVLFSGTLRENILYGKPTASDEEVYRACQAANALEFIHTLRDGIDTEVGERGTFLSGGQKQRITIARAFLKDPSILVLDEPTSALDAESERLIQEALERLMKGRTTFIIAHRLSTIVKSDLILLLEDGGITERGTHQELLLTGGQYRRLYEEQFESAWTGGVET